MNKQVTLIIVVGVALMALAAAILVRAGGNANAQSEPGAAPMATAAAAPDLSAGLVGSVTSPEISGRAAYDVDDGAAELEVAVRAAGTAAGRTLAVFIDGAPAGNVTLDDDGRGALRADSEDGQTVPAVTAGSTIEVRQDDQVIASGQFLATDDDNANDNGDDDDNANDNSDDDNANDNGDDDDNANDNGDDDNANDNGDDDNANDNGDDDDNGNDNSDDDDSGNDDDDDSGNDDDDNDDDGDDD